MIKKGNTKSEKQNLEGDKDKFDKMIQVASNLTFTIKNPKQPTKKVAKNSIKLNSKNYE